MLNSIRFRFTAIYFLLVFIAMIIAGIFIVNAIEDYNVKVASERLDDISEIMFIELLTLDNYVENSDYIQETIEKHSDVGLREEIYVVDVKTQVIIATSTENVGLKASDILQYELLLDGYNGQKSEKDVKIEESSISIKDKIYPIYLGDELESLLYLRYDLKDVEATIQNAKEVILMATGYSVIFTILLGFIISKSITGPINEVTKKATRLAAGEYDQVVEVKSDDEIGRLSESFNFLTYQLRNSMSETVREKSKLEAVINHMEDGVVAIDSSGNIIHFNPKAAELLSVLEEEKDDTVGSLLSLYNTRVIDENTGTGKKITSYGDKVVEINFASFIDENSEGPGVVFVIHDVTESEKLELMRQEFVANVSHELKTPLTSIMSYTETILAGNVDDPDIRTQFLQVVNSEAARMSRLVKDLLELSSYDSERINLNYEFNDMKILLESAILKVNVTAQNKNQNIEMKFDKESNYVIKCDYDKIEQVVLNVLTNSIKYTDDGGLIKVDLIEENKKVIISVRDNGMGIPEKDLGRIFERFYRVDKARSRELGGSGLGLSIAKKIINAHDGNISIESEVGYGTKVVIVI